MLFDGFNDQSGLGFSFLALHTILLQSMVENRTLVASSAVIPAGYEWRWCNDAPRGYGCYFEPWSPCEQHLAARLASMHPQGRTAIDSVPGWDHATFGRDTLQHSIVRMDLRSDHTNEKIHALYAQRSRRRCVPPTFPNLMQMCPRSCISSAGDLKCI